jgi:hypothetical protein
VTDRPQEQHDGEDQVALSEVELEEHAAQVLPDREAMSLVNANAAVPVNAAVALNALSDNSTAEAIAYQDTPIIQTS